MWMIACVLTIFFSIFSNSRKKSGDLIWCNYNGETAEGHHQSFEIVNLGMDAMFMIMANTMCLSQMREKVKKKKGKAVPLQACSGPEGSRKLSSQISWQRHRMVVRLSALRTGRLYPKEMLLVLISVRGWVDSRVIVRSQGFYVNEKFQWQQLRSNQRPSDL